MMLVVTQVRSAIGAKPKQRGTLRALGLGRIGRCNTLPDRHEIWGMIHRVPHLVKVEKLDPEATVEASKATAAQVEATFKVVDADAEPEEAEPEATADVETTDEPIGVEDDLVAEATETSTMIKLHDLAPNEGARKRARRVARGIGGRRGKTAGRGMKGQRARSKIAVGFEGGQMPLLRRVPKWRGFTNPFRVEYQAINLDTIEASGLDEISPEVLLSQGLVSKDSLVKVLGRGSLSRPVRVRVHALSQTAEAAIKAAGGSIEIVSKPWGDRRPPHGSFNQHTNR